MPDRRNPLTLTLQILGVVALALFIVIEIAGLYYGIRARNAAVRAAEALEQGVSEFEQSFDDLGEGEGLGEDGYDPQAYCEDVEPVGEWINGECVYSD